MSNIQVEKIAQLTGHKAAIYALAPGAQPYEFLSGAGEGWVVRWDLREPELGRLITKVEANIFSLLHVPEQQMLVVGNMNGGVHWVDLDAPDQTRNIQHHSRGVFASLLLDEHILTIGGGGTLTRWATDPPRSLESLQLTHQSLRGIAYHADRKELAIAASDHRIYILDANSWQIKQAIDQAHDNSVFTLRFSPDGQLLLSGGRDAQLRIWEVADTYQAKHTIAAHMYTINDLAFHPDGHLLATASRDKSIKIWDARSFQLLKVIEGVRDGGHFNSVNRLYWSSYNNYLISCSDDRSIIIWKIEHH